MMGYLEYDAIGVGEMDLNYGLAVLMEDAKTYGLKMTSANLTAKGDLADRIQTDHAGTAQALHGTAFPPYRVVERDGVRVGFVSLLSPSTRVRGAMTSEGSGEVEGVTYVIRDPHDMAEVVIPEAGEVCDVLVLLAHMDRHELDELLPDFPEIDIAVIGHESKSVAIGQPEHVGDAIVLKATSQGQNIGHLKVTLDADVAIVDVNNSIHFLNETFEDDPSVIGLLEEFEVENRKIQKVLFAKSQLRASSGDPSSNRYLGLGACQACHQDAFDVYIQSRHARAYSTLSGQFVHRDTNCVGCHVTGWNDRGGFDGVRYRGAQVDLIDVQCEACHGPGSMHVRDGSYRDSAIESCVRCHTENDDPDFNFDKDWAKIAH
jgi:hypothetical protein